jgi:nitroreductase
MEEREIASGPPMDSASTLDRRRFLTLMGGATAGMVVGGALARAAGAARVAGNGVPALQPWTLPDEAPSHPVDLARALVGAAVLAPSDWNTQPWRFEADAATLRMVADPQRALPRLDPDQRNMKMALGAALENLLVAARAWGLSPAVTYAPAAASAGTIAEITWRPNGTRRDRGMFAAIVERRTNRRDYDGRGLFPQSRAQILTQVPDGVRLHWVDDPGTLHHVADVAFDATHAQVQDRRMQVEPFAWMRFGGEARRGGDGVALDALELSTVTRFMARRYFDPESWFLRFGADGMAKQARGAIRSSGAVALLTTSDGGDLAPVLAGQAYERVALKAAQLGIALQPMSAPMRFERHRAELARTFAIGAETPLLLLRLGHASRPDPSPRRSAWVVTSFRNT